MPPAVSFVDLREELEDGSLAEFVRRPDFRLSGVVIDDMPVEIAFFGPEGEPIEGSLRSRWWVRGDLSITEFQVSRSLKAGSTTLRLVANDADSYRYLAESIRMHPDQETLRGMMDAAGYERTEYFNLTGGIVALHKGFKF